MDGTLDTEYYILKTSQISTLFQDCLPYSLCYIVTIWIYSLSLSLIVNKASSSLSLFLISSTNLFLKNVRLWSCCWLIANWEINQGICHHQDQPPPSTISNNLQSVTTILPLASVGQAMPTTDLMNKTHQLNSQHPKFENCVHNNDSALLLEYPNINSTIYKNVLYIQDRNKLINGKAHQHHHNSDHLCLPPCCCGPWEYGWCRLVMLDLHWKILCFKVPSTHKVIRLVFMITASIVLFNALTLSPNFIYAIDHSTPRHPSVHRHSSGMLVEPIWYGVYMDINI